MQAAPTFGARWPAENPVVYEVKEFMGEAVAGERQRIGKHGTSGTHNECTRSHSLVPQVHYQHQMLKAHALNELSRIIRKLVLHPDRGFADLGWTRPRS